MTMIYGRKLEKSIAALGLGVFIWIYITFPSGALAADANKNPCTKTPAPGNTECCTECDGCLQKMVMAPEKTTDGDTDFEECTNPLKNDTVAKDCCYFNCKHKTAITEVPACTTQSPPPSDGDGTGGQGNGQEGSASASRALIYICLSIYFLFTMF